MKALEHPLGMARFGLAKPDVLHLQWLGAPELDRWLFRPRSPAVFTAHDIIPRRTLSKTAMWRTLFDRFERVVVHSERGREQLVDFGIPPEKVRVIGHPVFRSEIVTGGRRSHRTLPRADPAVQGDRGRGRSRPRRGWCAAPRRRRPARSARRAPTDGGRPCGVAPRLPAGRRARRALSESTVGLFPYRAEVDLSGALLQVLGAGVPAIVYDIGGLGEVVGRLEPVRSCAPGDVEAMSSRSSGCSATPTRSPPPGGARSRRERS